MTAVYGPTANDSAQLVVCKIGVKPMFLSTSLLAVFLISAYILGLLTTPFLLFVILKVPMRLQKQSSSR